MRVKKNRAHRGKGWRSVCRADEALGKAPHARPVAAIILSERHDVGDHGDLSPVPTGFGGMGFSSGELSLRWCRRRVVAQEEESARPNYSGHERRHV